MKIAIAAENESVESEVCPTAGRAPYYLLFEKKRLVRTIKNPFARGGGGAGFGVAQMLANEGVTLVISGAFGPNMVSALEEKGIRYKEVRGKSVMTALEEAESA